MHWNCGADLFNPRYDIDAGPLLFLLNSYARQRNEYVLLSMILALPKALIRRLVPI